MSELELFGLDGLFGWFRRNKGHAFVPAPGQKCLNCDTELKGAYCYHCGQNADTHHRTIVHLLIEAFEGLFHFDGRLWTTLPALFFMPGKLNRDLLEGRIARHVPPFRIFLVSLLILMLLAEHKTEEARLHPHPPKPHMALVTVGLSGEDAVPPSASAPSSSASASDGNIAEALANHAGELDATHTTETVDAKTGTRNVTHTIDIFNLSDADAKLLSGVVTKSNIRPQWLKDDLVRALGNKEHFFTSVFAWGHRLALLLLPIIGLSLGLLYVGKRKRKDGTPQRKFYLYDHLLVAMNLLSFIFLVNAVGFLLPDGIDAAWKGLSVLWTLWTFFRTLRVAYGSSILGAILKSLVLWVMTGLSFGLVIMGVIFVSLTVG